MAHIVTKVMFTAAIKIIWKDALPAEKEVFFQ